MFYFQLVVWYCREIVWLFFIREARILDALGRCSFWMEFPNSAWGRDVLLLVSLSFCTVEALQGAESPPKESYQISTELVLADLILKRRGLEFQEAKKEWLHFYNFCLKYCLVLLITSGEPPVNFSIRKGVTASLANCLLKARICWHTSNTAAGSFGSASWPDRGTGTNSPFILSLLSFLTNLQFLWPRVRETCSSSQNKIKEMQYITVSTVLQYRHDVVIEVVIKFTAFIKHEVSSAIQKSASEPLVHQWSKNLPLNLRFISDPKSCLWPSGSSVIQKPASDPLVHQWSKRLPLNLVLR